MKTYLKRIIRKGLNRLLGTEDLPRLLEGLKQLSESFDPTNARLLFNELASANQGVQQLLHYTYRQLHAQRKLPAQLGEAGFRCFSQNDEDGLLLYIFTLIGTTNKRVIEMCAGEGIECNASNLIINHGWHGLLFDGNEQNIAAGIRFYAKCPDTCSRPPQLVHAWITAENVNDLIVTHKFDGDIDLLSLDLDGMDYWIWKALTCVRPRVVVLEFTPLWGPYKAVTLPYKPDFQMNWDRQPWCCGASLSAFVKLGRERGYRLVGTNRFGFNAVFLRADTGVDLFPEVTSVECFQRVPVLRSWKPEWIPSREERSEWHDVVEV
jgi:hypothetical protein